MLTLLYSSFALTHPDSYREKEKVKADNKFTHLYSLSAVFVNASRFLKSTRVFVRACLPQLWPAPRQAGDPSRPGDAQCLLPGLAGRLLGPPLQKHRLISYGICCRPLLSYENKQKLTN
jgi:hypothetical protein